MRARFIDPGLFRTELVLEQAGLSADGAGGHAETWSEVATVFGHLEPVSARDRFGAAQTLEEMTHRVTMRHRTDVASGQRLRRGARIFEVLTLHDPDETGRYLVARTREIGL